MDFGHTDMVKRNQTDKIQNVMENSVHIIQKTNEIFGLENLLMSDCSYDSVYKRENQKNSVDKTPNSNIQEKEGLFG